MQDMTPLMFIKMEFTLAVNCGIIGVLLFLELLSTICGPLFWMILMMNTLNLLGPLLGEGLICQFRV